MGKYLHYYIEKIKNLKRAVTEYGMAQHKPILLLAIIKAIHNQVVIDNTFDIETLRPIFNFLWNNLVKTSNVCNIKVPFVALKNEGFWHPQKERYSNKYQASIDSDLWNYLQTDACRKKLFLTTLDAYFINDSINGDKLLSNFNVQDFSLTSEKKHAKRTLKSKKEVLKKWPQQASVVSEVEEKAEAKVKAEAEAAADAEAKAPTNPAGEGLRNWNISSTCCDALEKFKVFTISEFCQFNLDKLKKIPRIGTGKLKLLKKKQERWRTQLKITQQPSEALNDDLELPTSLPSQTHSFKTPMLDIPFFDLPLEHFINFGNWKLCTIGEVGFRDEVIFALKRMALYDFDCIEALACTSVEYFYRHLGKDGFDALLISCKEKFEIREEFITIADKCIFEDCYKDLWISEALLDRDSFCLLTRAKIRTLEEYNKFLITPHKLSSKIFEYADSYRHYSVRFIMLQKVWTSIKSQNLIKLLFTDLDRRSYIIYTQRILGNKTLNDISGQLRITRERVRQISAHYTLELQQMFQTAAEINTVHAIYYLVEMILAKNGGELPLSELKAKFYTAFKWDEDSLGFIEYLLIHIFNIPVIKTIAYSKYNLCLSCKALKKTFVKLLKERGLINTAIQLDHTKKLCKKCKFYCNRKRAWEEFLLFFLTKHQDDIKGSISSNGTLYKKGMSNSERKILVEKLLRPQKRLTWHEIFTQLKKHKPDLTERAVHGYIQAADVVLVERGTYMLRSALPTFPAGLYKTITNEILLKTKKNPGMLFSVEHFFKKHSKILTTRGCDTTQILFEMLKKRQPKGVRFIKSPYVTNSSNQDRFSISNMLEEHIVQHGSMPLQKLRTHFAKNMGVDAQTITSAFHNAERLITDDASNVLLIEDLDINRSALKSFVECLNRLNGSEVITAHQLYEQNKVSCLMLNITGPRMLFNLLEHFEQENFSFKYPQISKSPYIVSIKTQITNFIKETRDMCSVTQLEEFCENKHFPTRSFFFSHATNEELFRYLPGAWVHAETIGWRSEWTAMVVQVAYNVLDMSSTPCNSYAHLQDICDREDELPILKNDMWWTPLLVAEVLIASGKFILCGPRNDMFFQRSRSKRLNSFGDLCALLLEEDFDGAANLETFSEYLQERNLLSKNKLQQSHLKNSRQIKITDYEVYSTRGGS